MTYQQLLAKKAAIQSPKFNLLKTTLLSLPSGTVYKTSVLKSGLAVTNSEMGWMMNELKHLGVVRTAGYGKWEII